MPLLNPLRTSTYTSSTSASTTPTQSAPTSLYITTEREQSEDVQASYFSFKSSSSSSHSPSISPKNTLDSSLDTSQLLHPLYPLPERTSERSTPALTPSITPTAAASKDLDPLTRYLSSSESASSNGSASDKESPALSRPQSPVSFRPTPPPKEDGPFSPPRHDTASLGFQFPGPAREKSEPIDPFQTQEKKKQKQKKVPPPLNLHITTQLTQSMQSAQAYRPAIATRFTRPYVATPVNITQTGRPKVVSITKPSPAGSCFFASQASSSPKSVENRLRFSNSSTASAQAVASSAENRFRFSDSSTTSIQPPTSAVENRLRLSELSTASAKASNTSNENKLRFSNSSSGSVEVEVPTSPLERAEESKPKPELDQLPPHQTYARKPVPQRQRDAPKPSPPRQHEAPMPYLNQPKSYNTPAMRPIASLDTRDSTPPQQYRSKPPLPKLPAMYPTRLTTISSLGPGPDPSEPPFWELSPTTSTSSSKKARSSPNSSRPTTALTSPPTTLNPPPVPSTSYSNINPSVTSDPNFNLHHGPSTYAPLTNSRPKNRWVNRFVGQKRAASALTQRSRGAGVRPATATGNAVYPGSQMKPVAVPTVVPMGGQRALPGGFFSFSSSNSNSNSNSQSQSQTSHSRSESRSGSRADRFSFGLDREREREQEEMDELDREIEGWRLKGRERAVSGAGSDSKGVGAGIVRRLSFLGERDGVSRLGVVSRG